MWIKDLYNNVHLQTVYAKTDTIISLQLWHIISDLEKLQLEKINIAYCHVPYPTSHICWISDLISAVTVSLQQLIYIFLHSISGWNMINKYLSIIVYRKMYTL